MKSICTVLMPHLVLLFFCIVCTGNNPARPPKLKEVSLEGELDLLHNITLNQIYDAFLVFNGNSSKNLTSIMSHIIKLISSK